MGFLYSDSIPHLLTVGLYKRVGSHKCLCFSRATFGATSLLLGLMGAWCDDFSLGREAAASLSSKAATKCSPANQHVPFSSRWNPWSLPGWWSWKHHQQCEEWSQRSGPGGLQRDLLEVLHRACSTAAEGETVAVGAWVLPIDVSAVPSVGNPLGYIVGTAACSLKGFFACSWCEPWFSEQVLKHTICCLYSSHFGCETALWDLYVVTFRSWVGPAFPFSKQCTRGLAGVHQD